MIRVIFSDNVLNVQIPRGWHELSSTELRLVYQYLSVYDPEVAPTAIFCRLANAKIIREMEDSSFLMSFAITPKVNVQTIVTARQMSHYLNHLSWLMQPGDVPVRLPKLGNQKAVDANMHGVAFGDYLRLETLYQAYLQTEAPEVLLRMANILYRGKHELKALDDISQLNVFNWVAQIKGMFAREFKHFFKASEGGEPPEMTDIMNAQIRALTGGDVTREEQILAIDCWRALTELDAKAREAEELNKELKKSQK